MNNCSAKLFVGGAHTHECNLKPDHEADSPHNCKCSFEWDVPVATIDGEILFKWFRLGLFTQIALQGTETARAEIGKDASVEELAELARMLLSVKDVDVGKMRAIFDAIAKAKAEPLPAPV